MAQVHIQAKPDDQACSDPQKMGKFSMVKSQGIKSDRHCKAFLRRIFELDKVILERLNES